MLTIEYAKNLEWCDEDEILFTCIVKFKEFAQELPCGVNSTDEYEHIKSLWKDGIEGKYGEIKPYSGPKKAEDDHQLVTIGTPVIIGTRSA